MFKRKIHTSTHYSEFLHYSLELFELSSFQFVILDKNKQARHKLESLYCSSHDLNRIFKTIQLLKTALDLLNPKFTLRFIFRAFLPAAFQGQTAGEFRGECFNRTN